MLMLTSEYNSYGYTLIDGVPHKYYYCVKGYLVDHSKPFIYEKVT